MRLETFENFLFKNLICIEYECEIGTPLSERFGSLTGLLVEYMHSPRPPQNIDPDLQFLASL